MSPTLAPAPLYSRREQRGWYVYDFANSVFASSVVTLFLGPYLTGIAQEAAKTQGGLIHPLGIPVDPRSYWPYLLSLSVFLQILILPLLGAVADQGGRKKPLLAALAYTGALATAAMFFVQGQDYLLGGLLFLLANTAFGASIVVYNSFLPDIAPPEERDTISSHGWAVGYVGGGLLLALHLVLLAMKDRLGLTTGQAVRIALATSGLWWGLFTLVPLFTLKSRAPAAQPSAGNALVAGLRQLGHTLRGLRRYPQTLLFLIAYLIYNDALQTVIGVASQFGHDELKIPLATLAQAILMVQFVGAGGAFAFNRVAARIGAKPTVIVTLFLWTGVLLYAYLAVKTTAEFFVMAAVVGAVMGGSQALSRSLYSLMIPVGREAEYFSLYEISDKGTSWLGPLVFGLAQQFTHSYRLSILSLIVFFIAGLVLLWPLNVAAAAREAGHGRAKEA